MKRAPELHRLIGVAILLLSASGISKAGEAECFTKLVPPTGAGMQLMLHEVKLNGTANGGELVLLEMLNPSPRYIRIATQPGETAETVIARMGAAINEVSPFNPGRSRARIRNEKGEMVSGDKVPVVRIEGTLLKPFGGAPGGYIFAGTETGLGIPPPPASLTVSYDFDSQEVTLRWENPEGGYDASTINGGGHQPGSATHATIKWPPPTKRKIPPRANDRDGLRADKGLRRFYVIGCRGGILSNAGLMTLNYEDNSQEELDTQPFSAGVAPNWKRWSSGNETEMLTLEQGAKGEWKRFEQNSQAPLEPEDKPFYQLIKTRSPDAVGGIYRKFLALKSGHTYRLWTRMNTFELDQAQQNWSFSFHAAAHAKTVTLTSAQMAGSSPLPDGTSGLTAGQIAAYGPNSTTGGKFVLRSTDQAGPGSHVLDLTLPPDAEVITVWFRYTGPAPSTGVGFDWIKLKDITGQ